jgi:cell division protein ZapE
LATFSNNYESLSNRTPSVSTTELLQELVPPREFAEASFKNYIPHAEYESQRFAHSQAKVFATGKAPSKGLFAKKEPIPAGIYLDGGFGVGKTHLLAAIWHEFKGKKVFGSFIAYTGLIGALTFAEAVKALSKYDLVCIDEFELDDPGDTMMMSRLLNELEKHGVRFAATSNTPPNALGEGRFAATDFAREIHGIADRFKIIRIDGEDHRHRSVNIAGRVDSLAEVDSWLEQGKSAKQQLFVEDFDTLLKHLSTIHPSRYGRLLKSVDRIGFTGVHLLKDQVEALRFVAFIDRAYEAQVKLRAVDFALTEIFSPEYLSGGYRKKYLRAVSRIGALTDAS